MSAFNQRALLYYFRTFFVVEYNITVKLGKKRVY